MLILYILEIVETCKRIVGFKAGDRIGNLVVEPHHVLVEKYFRYLELLFIQI